MDSLLKFWLSPPVFWVVFSSLAVAYLCLKVRLARERQIRAERQRVPPPQSETLPVPPLSVPTEPTVEATDPEPAVTSVEPAHWLETLQDSQDPEELLRAIESVCDAKDHEAVDALGSLLSHRDPQVSSAAANALGLIGDPRGLDYLMQSYDRLEAEVEDMKPAQPAAAEQRDDPVEEAALSPDDLVWPDGARGRRLLERYSKPGPSQERLLLSLMGLASDPGAQTSYRYFALKNLELVLPSATPANIDLSDLVRDVALLLSDPDPGLRYACIGVLETCRNGPIGDYLEGALSDTNRHVRSRACLALAAIAPNRARKHLFALLSDPDNHVRNKARRALDDLDHR